MPVRKPGLRPSRPQSRTFYRLWALVAAILILTVTTGAFAAVPPLELAAERQASLKKGASDKTVDVSVTIIAGELASHTKSGVAVGSQKTLDFGDDSLIAWKVVSVLLTAKNPIADLQEHTGSIDASTASIETIDDEFIYVWGTSPKLALSRDLARIRQINATLGKHTWEFRLSGDLGVAGLPERIDILRSGEPFANVELEQTKAHKEQ